MTRAGAVALLLTSMVPALAGAQSAMRDAANAGSCADGRIGTRRGHAMAYDAISRSVVLFGGSSGDPTMPEPRSLWSWDGATWRCLSADGPPGREAAELAFDLERGRLVLHGGRSREGGAGMRVLTDTWEWDGRRWTQADSVGPRPRRLHAVLAFDPSRRAILMHGGLDIDDRGRPLADTWRWTGVRWEPLALADAPTGAQSHVALLETTDGVLLVAQMADSARCAPTERWQRARIALFALRDTSWRALATDGPCASGLPPAARTHGGIVLVGTSPIGAPWPNEGWRWRDGEWQRAESVPTPRRGSRAGYDPLRRRVVLFGGDDAGGMLGDTWEWDGERWQRRTMSAPPR